MKRWGLSVTFLVLLPLVLNLSGGIPAQAGNEVRVHLPYQAAGLTDRHAAAYLLDRFTFGPRPGDVDKIVKMGVDHWFNEQLNGKLSDDDLENRLRTFRTLSLTNAEIAQTYPNPGELLFLARKEGILSDVDVGSLSDTTKISQSTKRMYREKLIEWGKARGFRPIKEFLGELTAQKILRATYSNNQLREVLTDFWFNHFNVSITKNQDRQFVLSFERDAIRPNVLGDFRTMLGATAKHPAMLQYLDNAQSTAAKGTPTTMSIAMEEYGNRPGWLGRMARQRIDKEMADEKQRQSDVMREIPKEFRPKKGINENYARELLELHTLGVDGGYTQNDVVNVARAFTGWTMYPLGVGYGREKARDAIERQMDKARNVGFVRDGDFLFRANAHDATEKIILGVAFPAGGGVEEGEKVLDIVANHPSTAQHIALELATHFVSDTPSKELVQMLARTFERTHGDLRSVIIAIAESREFWSPETRRAKIKSPLELAVSALRALDADVQNAGGIVRWVAKMGEPLYAYQAPTGYPDRAEAWVNAGSLLSRMSFGMSLAAGEIKGVEFDLPTLNNNREPESAEAALKTYAGIMLPERHLARMLQQITPSALAPDLAVKVRSKNEDTSAVRPENEMMNARPLFGQEPDSSIREPERSRMGAAQPAVLVNVVGVIIGSPEFQRR